MEYFIAVVGIGLWVLVFLGGVVGVADEIKQAWVRFWVSRNKCPKCFATLFYFNDYGIEFSYCPNHLLEAYYEDLRKVVFCD